MVPRLALAVTALALSAACGGSTSGSSDSVRMSAQQIVLAAQSSTENAGSAKLALSITTAADGGQSFTINGSGAFDFAKKTGTVHTAFPSPAGGGELAIDVVVTGTKLYLKSDAFAAIAGKPWLSIDLDKALNGSFSQLGSSDPTQGLAFLNGARNVKEAGHEAVRGQASTHYTMTVDLLAAAAKLSGVAKTAVSKLKEQVENPTAVPLEVWVDTHNRVTRSKMAITTKPSAATEGKSATSTVITEFYDYGTPVAVTIPAPSEVADGSQILGGSGG